MSADSLLPSALAYPRDLQPDLFADLMACNPPPVEDCAACSQSKSTMRCHGAWFPDSPLWKAQYCTAGAIRAMERAS